MPVFRGKSNDWLTVALFYEYSYTNQDTQLEYAIFTTANEDRTMKGKPLLSFKKAYLELRDPTEYRIATELLGGWEHWQALLDSKMVRPLIDKCREELALKMKCEALQAIVKKAAEKDGYQAAKFLVDQGWLETGNKAKDAKAKKRAAAQEKAIRDIVTEDAKRLGLLN